MARESKAFDHLSEQALLFYIKLINVSIGPASPSVVRDIYMSLQPPQSKRNALFDNNKYDVHFINANIDIFRALYVKMFTMNVHLFSDKLLQLHNHFT